MGSSAMRCCIIPIAAHRPTRLRRTGTIPSTLFQFFDPTGSAFELPQGTIEIIKTIVVSSPTDSRISLPALQNACSSDYTALATDERAVHRGNVGLLDSRQNSVSAPAASVLIVGSGPAGLFAACELLRHGVKPRVVERRLAPHHEARGAALQPALLEISDRAGLIEPFLRAGVRIRQVQLLGPNLHEIATAKFADIGCKYEFQ